MENTTTVAENGIDLIMILMPIFIIVLIIGFHMKVWIPFINEKRYIKMEIERNTGRKKEYWKRQLKALYLLHIPIIGVFIINRKYKR